MSFSIQTNVNAITAQENLRVNTNFQSRTIQRLTSGHRINSAADDAAGLSIANTFRSDVSELMQGVRNQNDGLSTLQIADGGLNNISQMLDRQKTLAAQSASETFTGDRDALNKEFQTLTAAISRQAESVGLNEGGRLAKHLSVFVGGQNQELTNGSVTVDLTRATVDAKSLGLETSVEGKTTPADISTAESANQALTTLGQAATTLANAQSAVGKGISQLNYAVSVSQSQIGNFSSAQAQIREADVASEAANLTKAQVLQQASMAALAQANNAPQAVLALLRG